MLFAQKFITTGQRLLLLIPKFCLLMLCRLPIICIISNRKQHDQKTCPSCRQTIADGDEYWEITDVPDKQEMHDYVVSLASGIPSLSS